MDAAQAASAFTAAAASASASAASSLGPLTVEAATYSGRTTEVVVSDIRYGIAFGELNERLWSHIDSLLNLAQILAGMLAAAGVLGDPAVLKWAGGALAIVSAIQLGTSPRKRSIDYRDGRIRFHELLGRAWALERPVLDVDFEKVRAGAPPGLRALSRPAYNIVAQELQAAPETLYVLTVPERAALALAW